MKINTYILWFCAFAGVFFASCERDDDEKKTKDLFEIDKTRVYEDDSYENRLKDSVWYYYKYLSLWETAISPSISEIGKMDTTNYLKDNYTKYFQTASDVLGYLMYRTKASVIGESVKGNAGSGNAYSFYKDIIYDHKHGESKAYDWYSFLDRSGFITGSVQQGYISGYGMDLMYLQSGVNSSNADLFIRFVERNSAAYSAGLRRGDRIISLDGDTKIDYQSQNAENFNSLNNYLSKSTLTVEFRTSKGEIKTAQMQYKSNSFADPVFIDTVLQAGNKNVAYVGLSSFVSTDAWINDKGQGKTLQTRLREVFDKFSTQGVTDLVFDLRYNGGGSVLTAEYLADVLVPSSASGSLMYTYKINAILRQLEWDAEGEDFGPVKFSKKTSLNLNTIYFLVSPETASASELLINTLTPYMKVYMIGTYRVENNANIATNTYGKPVGFFPIDIVSANNQLYVTSFQMFNKDGYGDYFDGLKPNSHVWEFDSFKDFGQQDESMLASALEHINTGVFKSTKSRSVTGKTNFEKKIGREGFGRKRIQGMYKFPTKKIRY